MDQFWMLLSRLTLPQAPPPPEFRGHPGEDPNVFITECRRYFETHCVPIDQWVTRISSQLHATASEWWAPYATLDISWTHFCHRLCQKFDGPDVRAALLAQLYGHRQSREPVDVFLSLKIQLLRRLQPAQNSQETISLLIELTHPKIRPFLRSPRPGSLDELIERAATVERDITEATLQHETVAPLRVQRTPTTPRCLPSTSDRYVPALAYTVADPSSSTPLPRVSVEINNFQTTAIIDSAANQNFVNTKFLDEAPPKKVTSRAQLAARGQELLITGNAILPVSIDGITEDIELCVCPTLDTDVILGLPWLISQKATIDFQRESLRFGSRQRRTVYWNTSTTPSQPSTGPKCPPTVTSRKKSAPTAGPAPVITVSTTPSSADVEPLAHTRPMTQPLPSALKTSSPSKILPHTVSTSTTLPSLMGIQLSTTLLNHFQKVLPDANRVTKVPHRLRCEPHRHLVPLQARSWPSNQIHPPIIPLQHIKFWPPDNSLRPGVELIHIQTTPLVC